MKKSNISEQSKESGIEKRKKNLKPYSPGISGNPAGKPLGQRNYATIYREALIKLAESKKLTPEELEEQIEQVGIAKARQGDFRFFKDIRDRLHGLPKQSIDHTTGGKELPVPIMQITTGTMNGTIPSDNGNKEDSSTDETH